MSDTLRHYLSAGWRVARRQPFAVGAWFVCHTAWSMMLYEDVQQRVAAVMGRFPVRELPGERAELFLNEAIALLYTGGLARPLLTAIALLAFARLVLAPFIQAGVYASVHSADGPRGTTFLRGMRQHGLAFTLIAWLRLALIALPLYWLAPHMWRGLLGAESMTAAAGALLPPLLGFLLYGALIRQLLMYVQFGKTGGAGLLRSLFVAVRHILPISALALITLAAALLLGAAVYSLSWLTAGFVALIVYVAYPLAHIWLKLWSIAVQHRFWRDKTRSV